MRCFGKSGGSFCKLQEGHTGEHQYDNGFDCYPRIEGIKLWDIDVNCWYWVISREHDKLDKSFKDKLNIGKPWIYSNERTGVNEVMWNECGSDEDVEVIKIIAVIKQPVVT